MLRSFKAKVLNAIQKQYTWFKISPNAQLFYTVHCLPNTVSLGKGYGSKGKHHCKRTPSDTYRPHINISLTTTEPCIPSTVWQCNVVCCSRSSELGPTNVTG